MVSVETVKRLGELIRTGDPALFWEDRIPGIPLSERRLITGTVAGVYPHSFLVEYENRAGRKDRRVFLIADLLTRRVLVQNKAVKRRVALLLKTAAETPMQHSNASLGQRCKRKNNDAS